MPKKHHGPNPEGAAFDRRQAERVRKTEARRRKWGDGQERYQVDASKGCLVLAVTAGLGVAGAVGALRGWL